MGNNVQAQSGSPSRALVSIAEPEWKRPSLAWSLERLMTLDTMETTYDHWKPPGLGVLRTCRVRAREG